MLRIFLILSLLSFTFCSKKNIYSKIDTNAILFDGKDLDTIYLYRYSKKDLLLTGGGEHYTVHLNNPEIANAKIIGDTLRINSLEAGIAYGNILSVYSKKVIHVQVLTTNLHLNTDTVYIYNGDKSNFVSIAGGGETPTLYINDTSEVLTSYVWDAKSNRLLIRAHRKKQGNATITFISQDGQERRELWIKVKKEE